jgi:hypothetical protein
MLAQLVFNQKDGEVTKAYYPAMNKKGIDGQLATALFGAQKRSTAAKKYRRGKWRHAAYDVKNWSLSEVCRVLNAMQAFEMAPAWGWKKDPNTPGFEWVLYVELYQGLPQAQASFHSAERLSGPDFKGEWKPMPGSEASILAFCDSIWDGQLEDIPI